MYVFYTMIFEVFLVYIIHWDFTKLNTLMVLKHIQVYTGLRFAQVVCLYSYVYLVLFSVFKKWNCLNDPNVYTF